MVNGWEGDGWEDGVAVTPSNKLLASTSSGMEVEAWVEEDWRWRLDLFEFVFVS